jgi:hypothetical protein
MSTATLTEGPRNWGFVLSEAPGTLSRENGKVKSGRKLDAGTVLQWDGGVAGTTLVAFTAGSLDSNGVPAIEPAGILGAHTDATDADTPAAYIARNAEVNLNNLTIPAETTAGGQKAATTAGLALLGIIARGEL